MGDVKIIITGSDRVKKTLTYDVGDEVNANAGDQVTWVVESGSGVAAITAITKYPDSPDLFSGPGGKRPVATNSQKTEWQGTLSPADTVNEVESYSITWTSVGGGWHNQNVEGIVTDPKIRISLGQ